MQRIVKKLSKERNKNTATEEKTTGAALTHTLTHTEVSKDIGLKLIYENPQCDIDIVAIHGDGGHYEDSWTHPETHVFWLHDLLPQSCPRTRVLSFGYPSSNGSSPSTPTKELASILLTEFSQLREVTKSKKRPIIFLAHSFGVMIMKGALVHSLSSNSDILSFTEGILFFGTPPNISHEIKNLLSVSSYEEAKVPPHISALKKDVEWLQVVGSEYASLELAREFSAVYFLESSDEDLKTRKSLEGDTIEDRRDGIRLGKTHGMMIRFANAEDADFKIVFDYLTRVVTKICDESHVNGDTCI